MRIDLAELANRIEEDLASLRERVARLETQLEQIQAVKRLARNYEEDRPAHATSGAREEERNRRESLRLDIVTPCRCVWGDAEAQCETADLSFGGARLVGLDVAPPEGTRVQLTFGAPGEVGLEGRVVYTANHLDLCSLGVRFLGKPEKRMKAIFGLLQ